MLCSRAKRRNVNGPPWSGGGPARTIGGTTASTARGGAICSTLTDCTAGSYAPAAGQRTGAERQRPSAVVDQPLERPEQPARSSGQTGQRQQAVRRRLAALHPLELFARDRAP